MSMRLRADATQPKLVLYPHPVEVIRRETTAVSAQPVRSFIFPLGCTYFALAGQVSAHSPAPIQLDGPPLKGRTFSQLALCVSSSCHSDEATPPTPSRLQGENEPRSSILSKDRSSLAAVRAENGTSTLSSFMQASLPLCYGRQGG